MGRSDPQLLRDIAHLLPLYFYRRHAFHAPTRAGLMHHVARYAGAMERGERGGPPDSRGPCVRAARLPAA